MTTLWCDPSGPPLAPEPKFSSGSHSILYFVIGEPPSAGGAFHSTLIRVWFHAIETTRGDYVCYDLVAVSRHEEAEVRAHQAVVTGLFASSVHLSDRHNINRFNTCGPDRF